MSTNETTPAVSLAVVPALEVVTAAASSSTSLAPVEAHNEPEKGIPADIRAWRERVAASISPFERSDLDLAFSTISATLFLFYTVIREGHREPAELVAHLRAMTDERFLDAFAELLQLGQGTDGMLDPRVVEEALERDRARETVPFAEEARRLVSLLSSPGAFRAKLADVIEWFSARFVADERDRTDREIGARLARLEPALAAAPADTLDALSAGNYDTLLSDRPAVTIFPVHLAGDEHMVMLPGDAYIVCGSVYIDRVLPPEMQQDQLESRTDELLKAIADPNRLAMLRLLRRRSHYGKELADEIGVSPGTASYHLEKLVTARLARLELSQGRRFYYSVNPRGIRDLRDCLTREFLEG